MRKSLATFVRRRAHERCEYCQLPRNSSTIEFEIDHIISLKHGGKTDANNLALACFYCNSFKGPNIAGLDSLTGEVVRLFHPRKDKWDEHFVWDGAMLDGQTAIGRVTVDVLGINDVEFIAVREALIAAGEFPPG
ncbi:MAG TPA: HNH endonuclease signature motif containing protein [Pirellulales bacterium]|nr:HNH endonuclease signature motif containing protein [Pirellulales bacterium]